jgi:DNA-directed RNA polymerase II subunit RPB1
MIIESQLSIKNVVVKYKLDKDTFDYIIKQVELKVISSFIQPGELVGVVSAQSLGEPTTQMTLNTFHSTGISSKSVVTTTGVPRMRELLNHSKNIRTRSMTIYLKNELQFDKNKADLMKYQLQFTTIGDIINTSEIIYEKNKPEYMNEEDAYMKSYEMFNEIIGLDNINMVSPWTLKLTFDPDALLNSNIIMSELQEAIISNDAFEDHIKPFFTDDNSSNLVLKIKIGDFKDDEDSIQFLKEIEKHILCIKLRGITGIRKVGMEEMNIVRYYEDGVCENAKEWTLNTDGSNLLELMTYDDIDPQRTTSNDINEILEIFGIEGARSKYIEEFQHIMQESGVNYRHIELLADIMTYKGTIMQIDRHGINKSADNGPIKKATFEETGDVLVNSAIFAEVDKMKGVSANVMFGQYPRAGTNAFDILIDDNMIINDENIEEDEEEYITDLEIDINQIDKQLEEDFKNKTGKIEKVNDNSFILDAGIHTVNIKPIKKKMNKVEVKII